MINMSRVSTFEPDKHCRQDERLVYTDVVVEVAR